MGVSRDGPNFFSTPYYLRNAKSYELQIWQVYSRHLSDQKTFKNLGEKGALAYPGTSEIFKVFLLSQERVKLQTSNLASIFRGSMRTSTLKKFGSKGSVGVPGSRQSIIFRGYDSCYKSA